MFLTFLKDITKNCQDGITYICQFKEKQEVELNISRTAFDKIQITNDNYNDILSIINDRLSSCFKSLDDDEILK